MLKSLLILAIALQHVYILCLEMFMWTSPRGRRVFRTTVEFAEQTKVLAANQGLYNGFLAAGLFWAFLSGDRSLAVFFLSCVAVAGVYGGMTASRGILYVQGIPAMVALASVLLG